MGKIKKIKIISMILIVFTLFGGCSAMKRYFANEEEAKKYLLESMEKKYNELFEIVGDEDFETLGGRNIFICTVKSKDDSSKTAYVRVVDFGEMTDDYMGNYFKEEAEKIGVKICESKSYIESYEVKCKVPWTKNTWDKDMSVEEFLKESIAYNEIIVNLKDGLTNEQYADQIEDIINDLYASNTNFDLRVYANDMNIFGDDFYVKRNTIKLTHERIIENIESSIRMEKLG